MSDTPVQDQTDQHFYPPPEPLPDQPSYQVGYVEPRPRPTFPKLTAAQLGTLAIAAVVTDLAIQTQVASISSTLATALIVGPLLHRQIQRSPTGSTFALCALVFAAWLPIRASNWLTSLNASAVVLLLLGACVAAEPSTRRWTTATISLAVSRLFLARFFLSVFGLALSPLRSIGAGRVIPVLRGIAIACIPVLVFGALLASADVVFAQSISLDIDAEVFVGHGFIAALAAAALAGLVAITSAQADEDFKEHRPLGATEALVLLLSVGGLYAAFALVQLLNSAGRADQILQEQGLTYAEYARSGFFQLLWVAGLTLIVLAVVRLLVAESAPLLDRSVRLSGSVVALLTILIVAVAIVRLGLYTDEFGQTSLRWYCTAFAWMLGAVFLLVAVGHVPRVAPFLPKALFGLVALTLFAVNVLNPEARVAAHNLTRADANQSLDAQYLAGLSADAWSELVEHPQLVQSRLGVGFGKVERLCQEATQNRLGPFGFNLARARLDCSADVP